ncbi:peroxiredoxin [Gardnerella vaginalis JCP8070]|nr:peroxiredoxin [Gardnerella vaginalis JCP8070]
MQKAIKDFSKQVKIGVVMSLIGTHILPFKVNGYKNGNFVEVSDSDVLGKWAIFFFYPADFSFVCPTELEDLANHYEELQKLGVEVYSVSTDTHFVHKAWHDDSKAIAKVQYTMLGDPNGALSRNFNALNEESGLAHRATFLVDPQGNIQFYEMTADGIGRNADEMIRKIKAAQFIASHPGEVCPAKWEQGEETLAPSIDLVGKI